MDFAVELLWKMRQRGINCNVHTYSCLMNVCIKNNDLDMALNVFQKLQVRHQSPSLWFPPGTSPKGALFINSPVPWTLPEWAIPDGNDEECGRLQQ